MPEFDAILRYGRPPERHLPERMVDSLVKPYVPLDEQQSYMNDGTWSNATPTKIGAGYGGAQSWSADPSQQAAYGFFRSRGWSPAQAAGIVGGLRGETANLNTSQVHDNGTGLGIAGWNGTRLAGLKDFAASRGTQPTDLQTQLMYVDHELRNGEAKAGDLLRGAKSPGDAGQAMLAYFRPKDWDKPGAHPERAQYASQFAQSAAGASAAPSSQDGSNVLAMTPQAKTEDNVASLLGLGAKSVQAQAANVSFTPSRPAPFTPLVTSPVVDFTKVAGAAEYPKFEVGKPLGIVDSRGAQRTLHPVNYDPFAGEIV